MLMRIGHTKESLDHALHQSPVPSVSIDVVLTRLALQERLKHQRMALREPSRCARPFPGLKTVFSVSWDLGG